MMRFSAENSTPPERPSTLHTEPAGFQEELERAALDESRHPLGRVDEVERVPRGRRVEHQQVVARLLVQLVELFHRHVLLRARHRVGDLLVDAVLEDAVARLLVGRVPLDRSSKVRFASSIIAHSSPFISMPCAAKRSGSTSRSSLPSSGRPSELARRFAGSMVSTATFRPCGGHAHRDRRGRGRLADPARARADADLPALQQVADVHARGCSSISSASVLDRVHVELRVETGTAARPDPGRDSSRQALELLGVGRRPAMLRELPPAARPGG